MDIEDKAFALMCTSKLLKLPHDEVMKLGIEVADAMVTINEKLDKMVYKAKHTKQDPFKDDDSDWKRKFK